MKKSKVIVCAFAALLAFTAVFSVRSKAYASVDSPALRGCGPKDLRSVTGVAWDCYIMPLLSGIAFLDTNADGKWQAGEPAFAGASLKVTGGGAWYVCGPVGPEGTFGVPVNADTYYVIPAAPPGYRTTTPRITVSIVNDISNPYTLIGFVADAASKGEACDQYNPSR